MSGETARPAAKPLGRRHARRQALFLLYQWDLTGQPLASLFEGDPDEFAARLATAVSERAPALDERVTGASEGWPADRLGTLERNILRIGAYELLYDDQVPDVVAVSEAVALARDLSTDESPTFVNGLLARLLQLKPTLGV